VRKPGHLQPEGCVPDWLPVKRQPNTERRPFFVVTQQTFAVASKVLCVQIHGETVREQPHQRISQVKLQALMVAVVADPAERRQLHTALPAYDHPQVRVATIVGHVWIAAQVADVNPTPAAVA
jgi:hypothetical protein